MKSQLKLIVVAISGILFMAVFLGILSTIAKAGSMYMRTQVCKLKAAIDYITDIKTRILERVLPFGIFVTSTTCDIDVEVDSSWAEYYAEKAKTKDYLNDKFKKFLSAIYKACSLDWDTININKNIKENIKRECTVLLTLTSLADAIRDTWITFHGADQNVKVYKITIPKEFPYTVITTSDVYPIIAIFYYQDEPRYEDSEVKPYRENSLFVNTVCSIYGVLKHIICSNVKNGHVESENLKEICNSLPNYNNCEKEVINSLQRLDDYLKTLSTLGNSDYGLWKGDGGDFLNKIKEKNVVYIAWCKGQVVLDEDNWPC